MNKIAVASAAAGVLAVATVTLAGAADAAPTGPPTAADTVTMLQAHGYNVVVNRVGTASLDTCTMYSVRPGQTYTRMDTGFPGAGNDVITQVVAMTVYVDTHC